MHRQQRNCLETRGAARFWPGVAQITRSPDRAGDASLCFCSGFLACSVGVGIAACAGTCCVQPHGTDVLERIGARKSGAITRVSSHQKCRFCSSRLRSSFSPDNGKLVVWRRLSLFSCHSFRRSLAANPPLAARLTVGHIDLVGDVAEWLKAAVC